MAMVASVDSSWETSAAGSMERYRARVLACFLPAAAALLMVGEALTPKGLDKPTTTVAAALDTLSIGTAHSGRVYASNLLVIFGLGALGVSFAALATLTRTRGATLGTVAALIGGVAAFCGAVSNLLVGFNVAAAGSADVPPTAAARVLATADSSTAAKSLLATYLVGGLVAAILITVALVQSQTVPRWLPVLFSVGLVLAGASRPGLSSVAMQLPFAVAMLLLATRVWRHDRAAR